jgi:hypothetical protein
MTKKKKVKSSYWKLYYHKTRKHRSKARPVKMCVTCGKPIINPGSYKQNVCLEPNVRSECQIKRDSVYKATLPKSKKQQRIIRKKPVGLHAKYNIKKKRTCLKCGTVFPSQSLHNRICEKCKMLQENTADVISISLGTQYARELLYVSGR